MATRPQRATRTRPPRSITAAAMRLGAPSDDQGTAPSMVRNRTEEAWKREAWACYHGVGEVKFATRFRANSLARLRLFPAIRISDEDDPVHVRDAAAPPAPLPTSETAGPTDPPPAPLSESEAALVMGEWERLSRTPGGMAELQRSYGVHMTIPGETNLVMWIDGSNDERWAMLAETCIRSTDRDNIYEVNHPDTGRKFLIDTTETGHDFAARMWLRDEAQPWKSDSNLHAALDIVEELLIYQRAMRATGRSRTSAGILFIANEFDLDPPEVEETDPDAEDPTEVTNPDESADNLTDFERGIVTSFVQPTEDDGSAGSVAPHIVRGPMAAIKDGVRWEKGERSIDEQMLQRIDHLIQRLAHALDVPVEVIEGIADANHWTAWFIEDTTYKAHIEPLAQMLCDDLARVFLRPAIIAAGLDPAIAEQIVLGIDPSGLVVRPNRYQDAVEAHKLFVLSDDALRRYGNFADTDAPSDEEIVRRVEIAAGTHGKPKEPATPRFNNSSSGGAGGEGGGDPTPAARRAITAAAGSRSDLGARLAGIDNRLAARLQAAASAALSAVLARAGSRLRGAVQGDPALAAQTKGVPNEAVGAAIGPGRVAAADLVAPEDFASLQQQWTDWVRQARDQAVAAVRSEGERRGLDEGDIETAVAELRATEDQDIASGWSVLSSGLVELGRNRVYTPDATPDQGEFDPHMSVPMGLIRSALGTMGDGGFAEPGTTPRGGGPATGASMMRLGVGAALAALGAATIAYQWSWGGGANAFEPHADLDGMLFDGPDDPGLQYDDWPADGGNLFPGDHDGCTCSFDPVIAFGVTSSDTGDGGGETDEGD